MSINKPKYWKGKTLTPDNMEGDYVFVFGSNPEGRHGLGAAKAAMMFGAKYGKGRGLEGNTYALVTKNLKAGYKEYASGITYPKAGKCSVSLDQITANIAELYLVAKSLPNRNFYVTYQANSNNLNGYSPNQIVSLFRSMDMPNNIILHESFSTAKPKFRLVVAGGRFFKDFDQLTKCLDKVLVNKAKTHQVIIVSGKAKGADTLGEKYAKLRGYAVAEYPANWDDLTAPGAIVKQGKYGEYNAKAGFDRNEKMALNSDATCVFWDGKSTGTDSMIKLTQEHGNLLKVFRYTP